VSDYRLGPEDVIRINVYRECPDLCADHVVVRPDGKVSFTLIGELIAAGKTQPQLEKEITAALTECCLMDPKVTVSIVEINSSKVSILGEVKKPDRYKISPQTTLLDVIAMAGGMTDYAKKKKVQVKRYTPDGGSSHFEFDVERMMEKGSKSSPFYVLPNDIINVP